MSMSPAAENRPPRDRHAFELAAELLGLGQPLPDTDDLRSALRHYERLHIARVLRQCPDKREAARRLRLGLSSLYRKIEELDISP